MHASDINMTKSTLTAPNCFMNKKPLEGQTLIITTTSRNTDKYWKQLLTIIRIPTKLGLNTTQSYVTIKATIGYFDVFMAKKQL